MLQLHVSMLLQSQLSEDIFRHFLGLISGFRVQAYSRLIIIIIIISIFKEDNVFSITASLPYGPPVNTDTDYYQTFFGLVYFCKCCEVSCAIVC